MQTFCPSSIFIMSAKILDNKRLGKQRVEAKQILNALQGKSKGWTKHPATLMWKGFEEALKLYHNAMVTEWVNRGFKNTMELLPVDENNLVFPQWLGDPDFHASHRSNLLRKDKKFYSRYNWSEDSCLEYVWPSKKLTA